MLSRSAIDEIVPILRKDAKRALRMRLLGFPAPYFCTFLLRDDETFNVLASSGSIYRKRRDRKRHVYCDLRVGSYRYDQVAHGGLMEANEDDEPISSEYARMPIDDESYDGLRIALWRLSEAKFKEALTDYNAKNSSQISTVDPNRKLHSFIRTTPRRDIRYDKPEPIDERYWTRFCRSASRWMSELPKVLHNWVEFDVSQESKILVNTENSIVVQHQQIFSLIATFRTLTPEGSALEKELIINAGTQDELPTLPQFKKLALEKYNQLLRLSKAQQIHAFSGPVLLYPQPAGLLLHEAIGHRLEGSRLLSSGEGQTFKGQRGKRVLNVNLTVRDNPRLRAFNGRRCIGAYDYDDEGMPAKDALLIEDGYLKDFLSTRAPISQRGFEPNGHARNLSYERPISRMGVTIIEGKQTVSMDRMKELLLREVRKQNKPFGMIVYETAGGETDTTSYDFQAFSGEVSYASLIYPDGKEVFVRGVNFVGTPLQALHNIVAVGDKQELDNGYCGAESGFIPVSTISPAVLLRNLELQSKEEQLITQNILPRPRRRRPKKPLRGRSGRGQTAKNSQDRTTAKSKGAESRGRAKSK